MEIKNELAVIVENSQLDKNQAQDLLSKFTTFFEQASQWETKAKEIVVSDETDVPKMLEAREARLALKKIRTEAENTRKALKERSLREGKAIDGIANVIKALVVPLEEHLEKQEKFVELAEDKRKKELAEKRILEISQYFTDPAQLAVYNFADMADDQFTALLKVSKEAFELKQKAEKEAQEEADRREKEKQDEDERIRKENAKLKEEADKRDEELRKERAEKDRLEREKREDEAKRKGEEARLAEIERQKSLAPDKEKISNIVFDLRSIKLPDVSSENAKMLLKEISMRFDDIEKFINDSLNNL